MSLTTIVPYDPVLYAGSSSEVNVILLDPADGTYYTIWFCSICSGWTVDRDAIPSNRNYYGWEGEIHIEFSSCHHDLEDLIAALPKE